MSTADRPTAPPSRAKQLALLAAVVLVLAVVGWRLWVHGTALTHFRNGKELLDRDQSDQARGEFDRALATWPASGETHFLAARAARRTGDLAAARKHLGDAVANGWSDEDVALERALIAAQEGELEAVEPFLLKCLNDGHADGGLILEVLTPLYYSRFRLAEAKAGAARWVERRPQSAKAWNYQGEIFERLRVTDRAVENFREAVRLDPGYGAARKNLIAALLDAKQPPDEIAAALEPLLQESPSDPAVLKLVIRCREAQGRQAEAIAAADELLKIEPGSAEALHARGRLELDRGRAASAAPFLREAAARAPYDPDVLYTWGRCLNEIGPPEEAKTVAARLAKAREDLQRLRALAQKIVSDPGNPELRREAGEICLRNGLENDGLRYLATALEVRPDHTPTHATLADYYAKANRPELADYHRARATPGGPAQPPRATPPPLGPGRS